MDRIYRVRQAGSGRYVLDRDGVRTWLDGDVFGDYRAGAPYGGDLSDLVAPVTPSKIMAIGLNYKDHAAEMNKQLPAEPLVFMKPATAVIGPAASIAVPAWCGRVDYESEMAIVIRRRARTVAAAK